MTICWRWFLVCFCVGPLSITPLFGGGGGLNTVVVVNQASSNSVALGNYYCERRLVPPQNILRVSWTGGNVEWTLQQFDATLSTPLRSMLTARQLTGQVQFVVLSMDIPYRVRSGTSLNSTTSALFYGFKADGSQGSCMLPSAAANPYFNTEAPLREISGVPTLSTALLTTMITASNLASAKLVVDQGVLSDFTRPTQPLILAKSADRLRNIRHLKFDNAVFDLRLLAGPAANRMDCNDPSTLGYISGYQNGMAVFNLGQTRFAPGSIADDLTSYGGLIFEPNDQTTLLAFLQAGASGTYGTVVEPCAHFEKFSSPKVFLYQGRGFGLAEAYYQSISHPYQGLMLGDPLAAPFAYSGVGQWQALPERAVISGTTNFTVTFSSPRNVQKVDLFLNGVLLQTVTNVAPQQGNVLRVALPGREVVYNVPAGASLQSAAQGLANEIEAVRGTTGVKAVAVGDRVQLQSVSRGRKGASTPLSASASAGSANLQTTFVHGSGNTFLDTSARGLRSYGVTNVPALGDWLQMIVIRTNGATTVLGATNTVPGTTLAVLTKSLLESASAHPQLQGGDGITIQDVNMHEDFPLNIYIYGTNDHSGTFNVTATVPGWDESQIKVCLRGSARLGITPAGTNTLDQNVDDLQPRAHLYLRGGLPALTATARLNTVPIPDGIHELTAVAYEGTHARTQTRASKTVRVQNTALSGTLRLLAGASNTLVTMPVVFEVEGRGGQVLKTEIFSTGSLLQASGVGALSTFSINPTSLGVGQHPFHAMITFAGGSQYRTETVWLRFLRPEEPEPPFTVRAAFAPPRLEWTATAGRNYDVLSQNDAGSFEPITRITATNSPVQWPLPTGPAGTSAHFYRVRTAD